MDRLIRAIPRGATVGIDTVAFVYFVEAVPGYVETVRPFFTALAAGELTGVTSVLTPMELVVRPLQQERPDVADDYELLLGNYPNLTIINVDRRIARRAAELRARLRLRPADSLHVATALESNAVAFLTNDRALTRVTEIQVLLIDDFRGE